MIIIIMHPLSSIVLIFGLPFLSSSIIFSLRFYPDVVLNNSQNKLCVFHISFMHP